MPKLLAVSAIGALVAGWYPISQARLYDALPGEAAPRRPPRARRACSGSRSTRARRARRPGRSRPRLLALPARPAGAARGCAAPVRGAELGSDACAFRSSCSISTAPSSTPAGSSSPRCATRRATVLGREIPDDELMAASAGPGSRRRCARSAATSASRSSCGCTAPTTSRFTTGSSSCRDGRRAAELKREGRRLGLVSAKRRSTVELAFAATEIGHCSTSSSAATRPPTRSPRPTRCCSRSTGSARRPREAAYVGDSPYDIAAAKAAGLLRDRRLLGRHPRARAARRRRRDRRFGRGAPCRPLIRAARAAELREQLTRWGHEYHVARRAERRGRRLRPRTSTSWSRSRRRTRRARHAGFADPARRRAALGPGSRRSQHLEPMGSLEKVTTEEGLDEVGRRRPQAARLRRAGRLRDRAEDRRPRGQPHLRGRRCSCAGATRGDGIQGEDVTVNLRTIPTIPLRMLGETRRRCSRCAARSTCRISRLPGAERAPRRDGAEARAEPAQRGRRLAAPEGLVDHRLAPARDLGLRDRPPRGLELRAHSETLAWLREHGFRTNPLRQRLETIEEVAEACRRGRRAGPSSTTRSTGSSSRSTPSPSRRRSGCCTRGRAGRARSSGRR